MSADTDIRPSELLDRYLREPTPVHHYDGSMQRELQRRHAHRMNVARQVLTGKVHARYLDDSVVEDLLENRVFTREEIDELIQAAEIASEEAIEKRQRRDLDDELRAARREAAHQVKAEEEAERQRKIEARARKNLGWPKTGYPE